MKASDHTRSLFGQRLDHLQALLFLVFVLYFCILLFGLIFPLSLRFLFFLAVTADDQSNDCAREREKERERLFSICCALVALLKRKIDDSSINVEREEDANGNRAAYTLFCMSASLLLHLVSFFSFLRCKLFSFYCFTLLPPQ